MTTDTINQIAATHEFVRAESTTTRCACGELRDAAIHRKEPTTMSERPIATTTTSTCGMCGLPESAHSHRDDHEYEPWDNENVAAAATDKATARDEAS